MKYHIYIYLFICIYINISCVVPETKTCINLHQHGQGVQLYIRKNLQGFSHQQHHPNNCPLVFVCVMIIRKSIYVLFKKQKTNHTLQHSTAPSFCKKTCPYIFIQTGLNALG